MDRKKDDKYFLEKVLRDLAYLIKATSGITRKELEKNEMMMDSIMFRFIQISENLKRISDDIKEASPHIPWSLVAGLRNKIVHEYGRIDLTIIYDVLKNDLEKLYSDINKLISWFRTQNRIKFNNRSIKQLILETDFNFDSIGWNL